MAKQKATRPNGSLRAVGYLRRSDPGQTGSLPEQKTAIIDYAARHGYTIVDWYKDDAITGDSIELRPGFRDLLADAQTGKFQFIICWNQDRFGRFDPIDAFYCVKPLRDAGVGLVTLDKGLVDLNTVAGRLLYLIEQEGKFQFLRDLSRNVLRGQIAAAKTGSWIGQVPYGYDLEGPRKQKRLTPNSYARIVERIFNEFVKQGRAAGNIAARLNRDGIPSPKGKLWRYDAIHGILANPVYAGIFRFNVNSRAKYHTFRNGECVPGERTGRNDESDWIIRYDNHPPIIDRVTFDKAQARLQSKAGRISTHYTPEDNPFLLSGLLRCGLCGSTLWGSTSGGRRVYECGCKQEGGDCTGTTVREDDVLSYLVGYIQREFLPAKVRERLADKAHRRELTEKDLPDAFRKLRGILVGEPKRKSDSQKAKRDIKTIEGKIAQARRNIAFVKDPATIPVVESQIAALQSELDGLTQQLQHQPKEQEINNVVMTILHKLWRLANCFNPAWETGTLKPILRELDHITVKSKRRGAGRGARYTFSGGEVHFRHVGGNTGKLNLHGLLQRQAAYH